MEYNLSLITLVLEMASFLAYGIGIDVKALAVVIFHNLRLKNMDLVLPQLQALELLVLRMFMPRSLVINNHQI